MRKNGSIWYSWVLVVSLLWVFQALLNYSSPQLMSVLVKQFLLTAGLSHEKSSRATNMTYTSMLFALAFDKIIWGITPGAMSILGSSLILGSAIYVAMQQGAVKKVDDIPVTNTSEEEIGLFQDCESNGNELNTFVQEEAVAPSRGWSR